MKKIIALFLITLKNTQESFGDLLGRVCIYSIRVIVIILFFQYIYTTQKNTSILLQTISFEAIAWPLIFTQLVASAIPRGITQELQNDLSSGKVAIHMLLPLQYIVQKGIEYFSKILITIMIFLPVGIIVGYFSIGSLPEISGFLLFGGIILLFSVVLSFLGMLTIASLGFFFEDATSFYWIYRKLDMVFGGNILPIAFMPVWLFTLTSFTPFYHQGYSLGQFLVHPSWNLGGIILGSQVIWIGIYLFLMIISTKALKKRLILNGS